MSTEKFFVVVPDFPSDYWDAKFNYVPYVVNLYLGICYDCSPDAVTSDIKMILQPNGTTDLHIRLTYKHDDASDLPDEDDDGLAGVSAVVPVSPVSPSATAACPDQPFTLEDLGNNIVEDIAELFKSYS